MCEQPVEIFAITKSGQGFEYLPDTIPGWEVTFKTAEEVKTELNDDQTAIVCYEIKPNEAWEDIIKGLEYISSNNSSLIIIAIDLAVHANSGLENLLVAEKRVDAFLYADEYDPIKWTNIFEKLLSQPPAGQSEPDAEVSIRQSLFGTTFPSINQSLNRLSLKDEHIYLWGRNKLGKRFIINTISSKLYPKQECREVDLSSPNLALPLVPPSINEIVFYSNLHQADKNVLQQFEEHIRACQDNYTIIFVERRSIAFLVEREMVSAEFYDFLQEKFNIIRCWPLKDRLRDDVDFFLEVMLQDQSVCIQDSVFWGAKSHKEVFTNYAFERICKYPWPENFAELQEVIRESVNNARSMKKTVIDIDELPMKVRYYSPGIKIHAGYLDSSFEHVDALKSHLSGFLRQRSTVDFDYISEDRLGSYLGRDLKNVLKWKINSADIILILLSQDCIGDSPQAKTFQELYLTDLWDQAYDDALPWGQKAIIPILVDKFLIEYVELGKNNKKLLSDIATFPGPPRQHSALSELDEDGLKTSLMRIAKAVINKVETLIAEREEGAGY